MIGEVGAAMALIGASTWLTARSAAAVGNPWGYDAYDVNRFADTERPVLQFISTKTP